MERVWGPLQPNQTYFKSPLQLRTFYSSEISLLLQFTHCTNQHNLSSGGKGADFSLGFCFVFGSSNSSNCHLKQKRGKAKRTLPSCKFENKNQAGHYLQGWGGDCLGVLGRQRRRLLCPCLVCPICIGITDLNNFTSFRARGP